MRKAMLDARKKLGWSQAKVAEAIGMKTPTGYRNIERGTKNPSSPVLVELEKLFNVPASVLMERTPTGQ